MKTIRMKTTAAGPEGTFLQGQVVTIDKNWAYAFVHGGFAEYEGGIVPPGTILPGGIEIATIEPREQAVMPRGKAKKK